MEAVHDKPPKGPATAADPTTDDTALGTLLAAAHQRCRQAFNRGLRAAGIEARHFAVLRGLAQHGPVSQRELIELLDVDKSAMVRIIDDLERQGLAERRRALHDRRAYAVRLTTEGEQRLAAVQEIAVPIGRELFGWLAPKDREHLVTTLRQLACKPAR